jgi:hypothetical protein
MKKSIVIIIMFSFTAMFWQTGEAVASPKKKEVIVENIDPATVWPVVKAALLKEGIQLGEISCDRQSAKSAPFTYTFITSNYMGRYIFTLEGDVLKVTIGDVHFEKDGKWESTSTSLAFSKEKKLKTAMAESIKSINEDSALVEKAKKGFQVYTTKDWNLAVSDLQKEGDVLIVLCKVQNPGNQKMLVLNRDGVSVTGCQGTKERPVGVSVNHTQMAGKFANCKSDLAKGAIADCRIWINLASFGDQIKTINILGVTIVGL